MKMLNKLFNLFLTFIILFIVKATCELEQFGRNSSRRLRVYDFINENNKTLSLNVRILPESKNNNNSSDRKVADRHSQTTKSNNTQVTSENNSSTIVNNVEPLSRTSAAAVGPRENEKTVENGTNYRDKSKVIGDERVHSHVHRGDLAGYKFTANTTNSRESIGTTWMTRRLVDPSVPGAQGHTTRDETNSIINRRSNNDNNEIIENTTKPREIIARYSDDNIPDNVDLVCERLKILPNSLRESLTRKINKLVDSVAWNDEEDDDGFIDIDDDDDDDEEDDDDDDYYYNDCGCGCGGCGCQRNRCRRYKKRKITKRRKLMSSGRRSAAKPALYRKTTPTEEITTIISTTSIDPITTTTASTTTIAPTTTTIELTTESTTTTTAPTTTTTTELTTESTKTKTAPTTTTTTTELTTESTSTTPATTTTELPTTTETTTEKITVPITSIPETTISTSTVELTTLTTPITTTTKQKRLKRKKCTKKRRKHGKKIE